MSGYFTNTTFPIGCFPRHPAHSFHMVCIYIWENDTDMLHVIMEGHLRSSVDLMRRKRACRFCDHCHDFISHANFYRHKKMFFCDGAWTKHATTPDNSKVEINMELQDCACDESLDSSEVEHPIWDVPLGK